VGRPGRDTLLTVEYGDLFSIAILSAPVAMASGVGIAVTFLMLGLGMLWTQLP